MEKFMEHECLQDGDKNKKTLYRMYDASTVEILLGKLNDYLAERFWKKELPKRINFERNNFAIACCNNNDADYVLVDGTNLLDNACLLFHCENCSDK